jgi:glycosyltransferase involved in cell wall biosynthesis
VPLLDIVLPCLDEAAALPWVLERLPVGARAIVVDNGSQDGSGAVAQRLGAHVVHCDERGYGAACHRGLEAASAEHVAFCDCDGTLDPRDVLPLLDRVWGGADLAVGRRRATERGAWSRSSRLANLELARQVRHRTGVTLRDVGPLRVARRDALLSLAIADRRSGYPVETVVRAAERGWRIDQVDVPYHPRIGTSKVTGTLRGSLQAVRDMRSVLAS